MREYTNGCGCPGAGLFRSARLMENDFRKKKEKTSRRQGKSLGE